MQTFRVEIAQVFVVERKITIEMQAPSYDEALELIGDDEWLDTNNAETPPFEDARWMATWELENEEKTLLDAPS